MAKNKSPKEGRGRSSAKAALQRELEAISTALFNAVEAGSGLPEIARIASRALGASTAIIDATGSVLAIAGASRADEKELQSGKSATSVELFASRKKVGELRFLERKGKPDEYMVRFLATVSALEVERLSAPGSQRADAITGFLRNVVAGKVADKEELQARAGQLEFNFDQGATIIAVGVRSNMPEEANWREKITSVVVRGARSAEPGRRNRPQCCGPDSC